VLTCGATPRPSPHPQVGWKHKDAVAELEAKRKVKAAAFYEAKKKAAGLRVKAAASV
jgi:large subunit ribosomal protein L13Ae